MGLRACVAIQRQDSLPRKQSTPAKALEGALSMSTFNGKSCIIMSALNHEHNRVIHFGVPVAHVLRSRERKKTGEDSWRQPQEVSTKNRKQMRITTRMTAMCPELHDLLSCHHSINGKDIRRPVDDIP